MTNLQFENREITEVWDLTIVLKAFIFLCLTFKKENSQQISLDLNVDYDRLLL